MKKSFALLMIVFLAGHSVFAEDFSMMINSIPLQGFTIDSNQDEVVIDEGEEYKITFDQKTTVFNLEYFGENYDTSKSEAETRLLEVIGTTKNEACFLRVMVNAVNPSYSKDDLKSFSDSLSFCSSPTQQDLNDDSEVNGVDFGQCIADYETSDEAESAFDKLTKREAFTLSTGQTLESLYELDLPCDFNVNRRIDALDLSKVIEAIKSPTSPSK